MGKLLIGEVAKRTGLRASTIRYYEEIGLIARARRSASGYRQYAPQMVRQLEFVQLAQGLGLSLDEVEPLIRLLSTRRRPPAALLRYGQRHLALARKQIRELKSFLGELRRMLGSISSRSSRSSHACPPANKRK